MRLLRALTLSALALGGCSRPSSPAPPAAPSADPSGPVAEAEPPRPQVPTAYVSSVAVLRREASEAAKVKRGGKELANFLAQLHRGEKVAVLETREDWAKVRSSDDSEGWIKRSSLIESQGLSEATVLAPADVFDRPDLLAANARRRVEAGTLVLVVRSRPPFSEVNVSGGQNAWVLTDRLNTSDKEVSVAKLAEQARYLLRNNKKDEALKLLALARERFDGAALVNVLAAELGEAPVEPPTPASAAPTTDPLSPDASGPQ